MKLLDLLRTFSSREWPRFRAFVASPYFNRSAEAVRLYDWLDGQYPKFEDFDRAAAWQAVFPGQPFDEKTWNHSASALLKLAVQFVGQEQAQRDGAMPDFYQLRGLSERGLEKHYRFLFEKTARDLADGPLRDARHFYQCYLLEDIEREHFARQGQRRLNENLQPAADNLDYFFLTEKLKYTCAMLNSQHIVSATYSLHFVDEVRRFVEANPLPPDAPGIAIYYRIFRLLTQDDAPEDFEALKKLLAENEHRFSREELSQQYQYALNYCIRQIRKVRERYTEEALLLYQTGINSGILLDADGRLSPWHFKNVIKLGLNLRRYEWTERFILDRSPLLGEEFKSDALHYNLADLYFHTGRKDEALRHLNKVGFTDVHYSLGSKVMLAKIYHETDAFDALDSLLHAFNTYLRRNRIISEDVRKTYLNFIGLLRQIIRAAPDKYPALREQVEKTELLTEKKWLLAQM